MNRFLAIPLIVLFFAIACGPKPGTPEYILNDIRQGKVVGGANLQLLGEPHLTEMLDIINDPKSPRMARLQIAERITRMELNDPYPKLAGLAGHPDPEVQIILVRWLGTRLEPAAPNTLIKALKTEKEVVVEANIISALVRVGTQTKEPTAQTTDELIAALEGSSPLRKKLWAKVLGGWRGEKIVQALSKLLASGDDELAVAAATSLAGPLQRPVDMLVPIATGMLNHKNSRVRAAGVGGLLASTYPARVSGLQACSEKSTHALLTTSRELPSVMKQFLIREDIEEGEKKNAKTLLECLNKFAQTDTPDSGHLEKDK